MHSATRAIGRAGCVAVAIAAAAGAGARPASAAAPPAPVASPVLVDEVVAFVGDRPVTLSDVDIWVRVSYAKMNDLDHAIGPVTRQEEAAALPQIIDWLAVLRALHGHYSQAMDPREFDNDWRDLRSKFPSLDSWEAFLKKLGVDEDELRQRRRQMLEASKTILLRLADVTHVDREQVDQLMHDDPRITDPERAREILADRQKPQNLRRIFAEARAAAGVRVVDSLGAPMFSESAGVAAAGGGND